MGISAVIFDFDGTLCPLNLDFSLLKEKIIELSLNYVSHDFIKAIQDMHLLEMIYEVENLLGDEGRVYREKAFFVLKEAEVEAARKKELFSYTIYVLKVLKEKGIKRGIITRTCLEAIETVFPEHKYYIDAIVTRDDVERVKPHPFHVKKVLELLGVEGTQVVLAGDHPTDIIAGNSLGLITVGVLTGRATASDFMKVGATYILQDIREILSLV